MADELKRLKGVCPIHGRGAESPLERVRQAVYDGCMTCAQLAVFGEASRYQARVEAADELAGVVDWEIRQMGCPHEPADCGGPCGEGVHRVCIAYAEYRKKAAALKEVSP